MCLQICVGYVRNLKWPEIINTDSSSCLNLSIFLHVSQATSKRANTWKVPESPESTITWKSVQPSQILRWVFSDMLCDYRSPAVCYINMCVWQKMNESEWWHYFSILEFYLSFTISCILRQNLETCIIGVFLPIRLQRNSHLQNWQSCVSWLKS